MFRGLNIQKKSCWKKKIKTNVFMHFFSIFFAFFIMRHFVVYIFFYYKIEGYKKKCKQDLDDWQMTPGIIDSESHWNIYRKWWKIFFHICTRHFLQFFFLIIFFKFFSSLFLSTRYWARKWKNLFIIFLVFFF